MVVLSSSISAKGSKTSGQEYNGYKWQCLTTQSPTQQNTVSPNKMFCVDQVTVLPPPPGNDKGWGRTKGGGGYSALVFHLMFC